MNKLDLRAQTFPGAVGTSLAIIWMTYGGWIDIVPPNLDQGREVALTAALGVAFTALANVVRAFLPKDALAPLTGERRTPPETTDPERREPQ